MKVITSTPVKLVAVLSTTLSLAACEISTVAPLCSASNAADASDLAGTYEFRVINQTNFEVERHEIQLTAPAQGELVITGETAVIAGGNTQFLAVCEIDGKRIIESKSLEDRHSQTLVRTVQGGIIVAGVAYSPSKMDTLGIPYEIREEQQCPSQNLFRIASFSQVPSLEDDEDGEDGNCVPMRRLIIDNSAVDAEDLLEAAEVAHEAFIRKTN